MNLNREKLAWAAGFFDGEGNVCANGNGLQIKIPNTYRPSLERFRDAVGVGHIGGPYHSSSYGRERKPKCVYYIYKFQYVQHVMCCLWPWLGGEKRAQFHAAVSICRDEQNERQAIKRKSNRGYLLH